MSPIFSQCEVAKSSLVVEFVNPVQWVEPGRLATITGINSVQSIVACCDNHCFRPGSEFFPWEDKDYPILNE